MPSYADGGRGPEAIVAYQKFSGQVASRINVDNLEKRGHRTDKANPDFNIIWGVFPVDITLRIL